MSVPSREVDNVVSRREKINKWHLPHGIRFMENNPADPTSTAEKELLDVKSRQSL